MSVRDKHQIQPAGLRGDGTFRSDPVIAVDLRESDSLAKQVLDHHLVERLIVSFADQCSSGIFIERTHFLEKPKKRLAAVDGVIEGVLHFRGPK
jgi:hypothetical protein